MSRDKWKLKGYDTFSGESYDLPGEFDNKAEAEKEAQKYLQELEQTQPSMSSGGQGGIQDRVFVISPEGKEMRIFPKPATWESKPNKSEEKV